MRRQKKTGAELGRVLISMRCVSHFVQVTLSVQQGFRTVLAMIGACMVLACAVGCNSTDYGGRPVSSTPWDEQWESIHVSGLPGGNTLTMPHSVRQALEEARQISYCPDASGEHWQTPLETVRLGAGDCEDISIFLYAELVRSGVDGARVCVGKRTPYDNALHCWIVWMADDATYILDPTGSPDVSKARMWPAGYYEPYYSYDVQGKYAHRDQLEDHIAEVLQHPEAHLDQSMAER